MSERRLLLPSLAYDTGLSQSSALKIRFNKIINPGHEGGLSLFKKILDQCEKDNKRRKHLFLYAT